MERGLHDYFKTQQVSSVTYFLKELHQPDFHHEFVKKAICMAFDTSKDPEAIFIFIYELCSVTTTVPFGTVFGSQIWKNIMSSAYFHLISQNGSKSDGGGNTASCGNTASWRELWSRWFYGSSVEDEVLIFSHST